jgi:hypothetical protein
LSLAASPRRSAPHVRQYLQRQVMVTHHELVAGQRIERLLQLLGLRDAEVPGVAIR